MKFSIEVEVSPSEVRELLGLPDVQPIWENLGQELNERVKAQLTGDPATFADPFGFGRQFLAAMQQANKG